MTINPTFQSRHFNLIAGILKMIDQPITPEDLRRHFAANLAHNNIPGNNPRFDIDRFIKASTPDAE